MTSQLGLASTTGVAAVWIAALQNTAAAALTMLSPARVAMGLCAAEAKRPVGCCLSLGLTSWRGPARSGVAAFWCVGIASLKLINEYRRKWLCAGVPACRLRTARCS